MVGVDQIPDRPTLFVGNHSLFGIVGPEECYDHVVENKELRESWLGRLLAQQRIRDEMMQLVPRGMLSSRLPKPQRCFIAFGEPVEVPDYSGQQTVPEEVQESVRDQTARAIEALIRDMLVLRAQHRQDESWLRRWLTP